MKITEIITEGPIRAIGRAIGNPINTMGQVTGIATGLAPATAKTAAKGFKQGYNQMQAFLRGNTSPKDDEKSVSIDREELVNRIKSGQMLNYTDVQKVKELLKGINNGTIKTNQNPEQLTKALQLAASGRPVSAEMRPVLDAFAKED